jgi:hypothetical protein
MESPTFCKKIQPTQRNNNYEYFTLQQQSNEQKKQLVVQELTSKLQQDLQSFYNRIRGESSVSIHEML